MAGDLEVWLVCLCGKEASEQASWQAGKPLETQDDEGRQAQINGCCFGDLGRRKMQSVK